MSKEDFEWVELKLYNAQKEIVEKDAEIERLREENECFEAMKQGVSIRIVEKDAEIERLRGLLTRCLPYIHEAFCGVPSRIELIEEIEKELRDE